MKQQDDCAFHCPDDFKFQVPQVPLVIPHLIPYAGLAMGGPVSALALVTHGLARRGHQVAVYHVTTPGDGESVEFDREVKLVSALGSKCFGYRTSPSLYRKIDQDAPDFSLVHSHLLWTGINRYAARLSRTRCLPHVISLHGTLATKALQHRGWKKLPVGFWFQNCALSSAACLHATAPKELEEIRAFGVRTPVAVVPLPVEVLPLPLAGDRVELLRCLGLDDDQKFVLYLGRLHPVKGLERLIGAWARLAPTHPGWQLILAGPDEDGFRACLERLIAVEGLSNSVRLVGPVNAAQKAALFADARLLVMPSDFENFGMAIAEALAHGLPVVTTTGTPWSNLASVNAGWWVAPTESAIAAALEEALALPDATLKKMGVRGAELARLYTLEAVSLQLEDLYRWLLGQAPRPEFVSLA